MEDVEVVVGHAERATVRVGDVFLKIDGDQQHIDAEMEAMSLAPVPTPAVLWQQPNVLALARVPGAALGVLAEPSPASPAAWAAAGAAIRRLHDAPVPDRAGWSADEGAARLERECRWLVDRAVLPADVVHRTRRLAERALRPWRPAFVHGDLQITHVFTEDDEVTGLIDWSEAGRGDTAYDVATLTLNHEVRLVDLARGYGDVDVELVRAWWAFRSLCAIPWLAQAGVFGAVANFPEVAVLRRLDAELGR